MTAAQMTDAEFTAMIRQRAAEPQVRALMAVLDRFYDYREDEVDFEWLVIDASRIADFVDADRALNLHRGYCDDPRPSILNAMEDSARWDPSEPEPAEIVDAILSAIDSAPNASREETSDG